MEYWCINDDFKPQWVQDLIDRKLLEHKPTCITDCYVLKQTEMTTSPIYLYDGDGLCFGKNKIGVVFGLYKDFQALKEDIEVVKYYCDMCGKEVFFRGDFYNLKIFKEDDVHDKLDKDICEDCYMKIKKIILKNVER